ncbi:metalloprotease [Entomophthora muscae]|uniref:Metalloprotease n=1 Tax=Entomophthora muscae TaxID=34485 RepID=A0ACC2U0D2_9FUNG|nr:metalloprotease [Entomophthora muscae]
MLKGAHFSSDSYAIQLSVVPVKDIRTLEIQFEVPSQIALYESKPSNYIAHLIGHEGSGSILSLLKRKGWVTELCSSTGSNHVEFAVFEISAELTPEGYEHVQDVIETIFQYIELIKKNGVNKDLFDELKSIYDLTFRFQEKSNISNYVSRLAGIMQRPAPPSLCSRRLPFSAKNRKDLKCEHWYGTQHCIEPIDPLFIKRLLSHAPNPDLHLPYPNPFIPSNFELVKTELAGETQPVLLARDPLNTVWYHRGFFEVPRVSMCLFIQNLYAYATPRLFICLELLKDIVTENLAEYGYDAQMAGLNYEIDVQYRGINIMVHGYSHKLEKLLYEIIGHLKTPKFTETTFSMCKEKMIRSLKNSRMNAPVNHAGYFTSYSMLEKMWTNEEKAAEAPHITVEELTLFAKSFFSRAHVETLVVGNYLPQDCLKMVKNVQGLFDFTPLHKAEIPIRRNVLLDESSCSLVHEMEVFDPSNVNSAIEFYLDIYAYPETELRAYTELICHMIAEPAFNQLRTVEQLGYIVFGGSRSFASRGGIRILIQSERDPVYLESRIECFLIQFKDQVAAYSPEEFQSRLKSLIDHKLKKDENLGQLVRRDWDSISSRFYDFDSIQKLVDALKTATLEKTVAVIEEYMLKASPRRRKFSLHMRSQTLPKEDLPDCPRIEDCGIVVRNIVDWKLTRLLSPAPSALSHHEVYPLTSAVVPEEKKANL